jgi:hypothetical protein
LIQMFSMKKFFLMKNFFWWKSFWGLLFTKNLPLKETCYFYALFHRFIC